MSLGLVYKDEKRIYSEVMDETPYLEYSLLKDTGFISHGFSTRLGGVSKGYYSSLNLGFAKKDERDFVLENFRRIGRSMNISIEDMVFSHQTHTNNVIVVDEKDKGNGITKPQRYSNVDGLVTNAPNVCLVTSYADCVPLYFVDTVNKVIGLSHSGWRGTTLKIARETVALMSNKFNSKPENILAAIGPSICQGCYEVSEDVIVEFRNNFCQNLWNELYYKKGNGKYHLDLWKANEFILREAGLLPKNIITGNLCTMCNSSVLFSHRIAGDKRGCLAAFLMINSYK